MKTLNCSTSACRFCRYYCPEGRRGGTCQQLCVPVRSNWTACSLALPTFSPSWKNLEEIFQDNTLRFQEELSSPCSVAISEEKLLASKGYTRSSDNFEADMMLV